MYCRHFDKDKSGKLDHHEFKSCLRALGYDLPMVEEGQVDPEFQAICDIVDPNRSVVSLVGVLVCQLYQSLVTSIPLHGCETGILLANSGEKKKILAFVMKCLRKLLCICCLQHKANDWVRSKINFLVVP